VGICLAQLGQWVGYQRTSYRKEKLAADRISRLESVGFAWNQNDENWMKMYNRLLIYKNEHEDCNVPEGYNRDPKLGCWVKKKRNQHNDDNTGTHKLSPKKLQLLNDINFFEYSIICI